MDVSKCTVSSTSNPHLLDHYYRVKLVPLFNISDARFLLAVSLFVESEAVSSCHCLKLVGVDGVRKRGTSCKTPILLRKVGEAGIG